MIIGAHVDDYTFRITFWNGVLSFIDDGQSCGESRYMTCDDDLTPFIGSKFMGAEVRSGPDLEDEWGSVHNQEFLIINTTKGSFTVANHNEHNGYYGGFNIVVQSCVRR
jgi:hypothetical protein